MNFEESDIESDEASDEVIVNVDPGQMISQEVADQNYLLAGSLVDEPTDEISLVKYGHFLSDKIHGKIMEVLEETKIQFRLSDFQLLSLHVLGSKNNLGQSAPLSQHLLMRSSSSPGLAWTHLGQYSIRLFKGGFLS